MTMIIMYGITDLGIQAVEVDGEEVGLETRFPILYNNAQSYIPTHDGERVAVVVKDDSYIIAPQSFYKLVWPPA